MSTKNSLDLNHFFKLALDSLLDLEDSLTSNSAFSNLHRLVNKLYSHVEELRYTVESFPKLIWSKQEKIQKIDERKDLYTARLLTIVLLQKITQSSKKLTEKMDFQQITLTEAREILQEMMLVTNHIEELISLQERLLNEGTINKQILKKLEKKYAKRIEELESRITGKEQKVMDIDRLIATQKLTKKRFFGKKKFIKRLADLITEDLPTFQAEFGAFATIPIFYKKVKEKYDVDLDVDDITDACDFLAVKGIIPGIKTLTSGTKVIELVPVEMDSDQNVVLQLALEKGYITLEEILVRTRWDEMRARRILEFFENNKIARYVQSFEEGERWYFPGLSD